MLIARLRRDLSAGLAHEPQRRKPGRLGRAARRHEGRQARLRHRALRHGGGSLAEDRGEILQGVAPFGPNALRKAAEVSDATDEVMSSNLRSGWAKLARVRREYGDEPWFEAIKGNWSGNILK